ncbi:GntR family transcriptional regulator [Amycolatopsis endophytica]|uniref:DNA-binding GntR family transcriptional regulator n=1 Tax=Amycolatopsis endophytica TaxID=860233 RepID=A0A853BEG5_9PSEU|nr:GntR family transcriptional regulator [Amycolatopsis endophytica]NYI93165.1 DNA-binding GntR family transcriptional regulator [Amycolatopsis endophytica]
MEVRVTNLRDQVLEVVRQAMVSGEIRPGDIYSAAALAARLGVSTSPVREAMLTLVNQGLMEPVRNRGFRVVAMSEQDLDEIYELRQLLEVPATLSAAAKASPADLERLSGLAREIEAAAAAGDVPRFLDADRRFHLDLLSLGGNRRLVANIATLRDQTRLYGLEKLAEAGRLTGAADEHRVLLEAIAARDPSRVEDLMRAHLEHTRADWAAG